MGLWSQNLGIFIRSRADFSTLRKHFRKFTRVQDEHGNWFLFRFWEQKLPKFFLKKASKSKLLGFFAVPFQLHTLSENETWLRIYLSECEANSLPKPLIFDAEDMNAFKSYKHNLFYSSLKKWLLESLPQSQNSDEIDTFLRSEIQFAIDHFKTYDAQILSYYAAASWILGARAWDSDLLTDSEKTFDPKQAKLLYDRAYEHHLKEMVLHD